MNTYTLYMYSVYVYNTMHSQSLFEKQSYTVLQK